MGDLKPSAEDLLKYLATGLGLWLLMLPTAALAEGRYATVDGLRIYYELHGKPSTTLPPLLLLHGGTETIPSGFRACSTTSMQRQCRRRNDAGLASAR